MGCSLESGVLFCRVGIRCVLGGKVSIKFERRRWNFVVEMKKKFSQALEKQGPNMGLERGGDEVVAILRRLCSLARIQLPEYSYLSLAEAIYFHRGRVETSRERLQRIGFQGRSLEFVLELFRLYGKICQYLVYEPVPCKSSSRVGSYLIQKIGHEKRECFYVLYLDVQLRVLHEECLFKGGVNYSLVDPRVLFHEAVKHLAVNMIVAHNHPSGSLEPSSEDIELTKRLVKMGDLLEITVLDHFIVTRERYYSFREHGLIGENS